MSDTSTNSESIRDAVNWVEHAERLSMALSLLLIESNDYARDNARNALDLFREEQKRELSS